MSVLRMLVLVGPFRRLIFLVLWVICIGLRGKILPSPRLVRPVLRGRYWQCNQIRLILFLRCLIRVVAGYVL